MTVINIDLEDGLPPVSFTLKPSDVQRFMQFMEENNKAAKEIESLRAKLAEAEKDSALLNEADRVGHVDAKFASIREEFEWVMTQNFESLDAAIANESKARSE